MTRPFTDLVEDLLGDVRRAQLADLELEAMSFAMAMVWASEHPRDDAAAVVARLASMADERAAAILRAFALLAPPVVREAAASVPTVADGIAGQVGRFAVDSAWRAVGPGQVADVVWFVRPDGTAQSLLAITGSDDIGAALLGGGMSGPAEPAVRDERLGQLAAALGLPAFGPVEPPVVLARLQRGAETNRALMSGVSVSLAMALDIAGHALGGDVEAVPSVDWALDEEEDDDERAAFLLRVLERAIADGVDAADPDALAAWRLDLAELSPREQLRALGLPTGGTPQRGRQAGGKGKRAKRKAARQARKRNR